MIPKRPRRVPTTTTTTEPSWRAALLREKDRETAWVLKVQTYRTPFLDKYFNLASILGEEVCYILALPGASWLVAPQLSMHLTVLLALSVGVGNILKNIFLIPRPPHPPVWAHKGAAEKDHGLPSTHTMTAITFPWYCLYYFDFLEPTAHLSIFLYVLAFIWSASIMISRVYNGHHTPMDVFAGAILAVAFLYSFCVHIRPIVDSYVLNNAFSGLLTIVGITVSALILHPVPPKGLTPAHAETGLALGTMAGAYAALWMRTFVSPQIVHSFFSSSSYPPAAITDNIYLLGLLRFVLGVVIVLIVRTVVKAAGTALVLQVANAINKNNKFSAKNGFKYSEAEVVVKYLTYSSIGIATLWASHIAFVFLGLYHPLDDTLIPKR